MSRRKHSIACEMCGEKTARFLGEWIRPGNRSPDTGTDEGFLIKKSVCEECAGLPPEPYRLRLHPWLQDAEKARIKRAKVEKRNMLATGVLPGMEE